MTRLPTIWTRHLKNKDAKEKLQEAVLVTLNSATIKRLIEILVEKEKELESSDDYNSPSWAYIQADHLGARRMLRQIKDLIDLK